MKAPIPVGASLRRTLLVGSVALVLAVVVGLGLVLRVESTKRQEFYEATDAFLEEQRIGEEITQAVSRQVAAASLFAVHGTPELMAEVQAAGDEAYALIRTYLFRDLTPEQRLKLEGVKEAHQRLEVAASELLVAQRTSDGAPGAVGVPESVVDHARALQATLNAFLGLRESDVEELRRRQETVFQGLHLAGAGLAVLLLGVSILFAGFLQRRLAGPLSELATAAGRVAEGDFTVRVELPHDDELAAVGNSFNRMVDTLADARKGLEAKNRELEDALRRLQETQEELVQSEKLSAVGEMMAGLAHELNNPLASVLGYGRLLAEELRPDSPESIPEVRESCVRPLVEEAERARELVRSLLRFSRRSGGSLVSVDLRECLETVERLRIYSFEQAGLALEVGEVPEVWVRAESQGLQQVFLNLMNNAFDAMEEGGGAALAVEVETLGSEVRITFADDGPGFPDPERAFEPFFTTKPVGKGTGLGLALVHRLVDEFGGAIRAFNDPSGGARVQITLQVAEPASHGTAGDAPDRDRRGLDGPADVAGARILVVEDEAPLRALQERLLGRMNARTVTAGTGEEARRWLETGTPDLVISDVKMPGTMSGMDLFRWIGRERPELVPRFLFLTGDTEQTELGPVTARYPDQLLQKPFELEDYVERVLTLLTSPAGVDGNGERPSAETRT